MEAESARPHEGIGSEDFDEVEGAILERKRAPDRPFLAIMESLV